MQKQDDELFNDYAWLAIAVALSLVAIWLIPSSLNGIEQEHLLSQEVTETKGRVVWLEPGARCQRSRAGISFSASGTHYGVQVTGCGAHPDHLAIGNEVTVRYATGRPEIAEATVLDASTARPSLWAVVCLWLCVFASVAKAIKEWRKVHPKK